MTPVPAPWSLSSIRWAKSRRRGSGAESGGDAYSITLITSESSTFQNDDGGEGALKGSAQSHRIAVIQAGHSMMDLDTCCTLCYLEPGGMVA